MRGKVDKRLLWSLNYLTELSVPNQLLSNLQYLLLFVSGQHHYGHSKQALLSKFLHSLSL